MEKHIDRDRLLRFLGFGNPRAAISCYQRGRLDVDQSTSPFSTERLAAMRAQYAPTSFDKETLLHDRYLLAAEGRYRVYYAGLGAQPSPIARVIFVGLTPGFSQMQEADRAFSETPAHVRNDPVAYSKTGMTSPPRQRLFFPCSSRPMSTISAARGWTSPKFRCSGA